MPRQMRPLTRTIPLLGDSRVNGGTTPGFSSITVPRLLFSTGEALASYLHPFQQQLELILLAPFELIFTQSARIEGQRPRVHQQEHEKGARMHSRPALNPKCQTLHPVNYKQYNFGIPLDSYSKSLKSSTSLKFGTHGIRTGFTPLPRPLSPARKDIKRMRGSGLFPWHPTHCGRVPHTPWPPAKVIGGR